MEKTDSKLVLALDIGTTTIKAMVINEKGNILGSSHVKTVVKVPESHQEEIEPNMLWESVIKVLRLSLKVAEIRPVDVTCVGVCTMRGSFITWSKRTGEPFHNIITWNDKRAKKLAKKLDKGLQLKILRLISSPAYMITGNKIHQLNKNYHIDLITCNIKLSWFLKNNLEVCQAAKQKDLMFGTLDSWLVYKLNGGSIHVTEPSNVISTGFWDLFTQEYSTRALKYFDIPPSILPKVVNSCSRTEFGGVDLTILQDPTLISNKENKIPITAVMGDQGASAFGLGCTMKGDMKVTIGTGTFCHMNTGESPHCSFDGLYPVICWKELGDSQFFVEGQLHGTSASLEWGKHMRFYEDPTETSDMAYSANDIGDLYFVPAFHGLQEPFTDAKAGCGFIGLKRDHGTKELTRAILESIAFGVKAIVDRLELQIANAKLTKEIKADGGISQNDFVMELIANLTGKSTIQMASHDMSLIGVAVMAGIQSNVWNSRNDINHLLASGKKFMPTTSTDEKKKLVCRFRQWKKACQHFGGFQDID